MLNKKKIFIDQLIKIIQYHYNKIIYNLYIMYNQICSFINNLFYSNKNLKNQIEQFKIIIERQEEEIIKLKKLLEEQKEQINIMYIISNVQKKHILQ